VSNGSQATVIVDSTKQMASGRPFVITCQFPRVQMTRLIKTA